MNYPEALDWLYGTQEIGIKLGLDPTRRLMEALEVDTSGVTVFHVAGTNGKGSVCAFIESICRAAGLKTGLFTSPHLISFPERIRIDFEPASHVDLTRNLSRARDAVAGWETHPTFFEIVTVLGLRVFLDAGVDVIVLETGMGGRLDSTNAVESDIAIITPIALDHQKWLGNSLEEIAAEKAGIFKSGKPALWAPQSPEVTTVLKNHARKTGAQPVRNLEEIPDTWALGLKGAHQRGNAALALTAMKVAEFARSPKDNGSRHIRDGLANAFWPARFQILESAGTTFVLDGAHNLAATERLVETWRSEFPGRKATLIFGCVSDKDPAALLRTLSPVVSRLILATTPSPRGTPAEDLEKHSDDFPETYVRPDIENAIAQAYRFEAPILITGSFYLVGKALEILEKSKAAFESSDQ